MQDQKQDQVQDLLLKLLENRRFRQVKQADRFASKLCEILHADPEILNDPSAFLQTCRGTWNSVKQESRAGKYVAEACFWAWCKSWRKTKQMEKILAEHETEPENCVFDGWTLHEILYSNGANGEQEN